MVQWLGLCAFIAEGLGSIPGQGTKIPQAARCGKKKRKKGVGGEREREKKEGREEGRERGREEES